MMTLTETNKQEPNQKLKKNKINPLSVLLVLGLLAILPVSLFLVKQKQEVRKEAAELEQASPQENKFSFNLHAPYNSYGNLSFSSLLDPAFLNYIDDKIKDLEKDNPGEVEIIRNSGRTGLIPKFDHLEILENCPEQDPKCRNAIFLAEPNKGWDAIEKSVEHITALGKDIMMEVNLSENVYPNGIKTQYYRDKNDIDVLEELLIEALTVRNFKNKIKYWQISNEPGVNKWNADETIQTDQGEIILLAYTTNRVSKIIKQHCPDCKIVLAGVGGDGRENAYKEFMNDVDPNCCYGKPFSDADPIPSDKCAYGSGKGERVCGYYKKLITDINILDPNHQTFDIFDFHFHNNWDQKDSAWHKVEFRYQEILKLLNSTGYGDTPVWITETSSYTGTPKPEGKDGQIKYPFHSEEHQARELVKRFLYPFSLGIEKIFWSPGIVDFKAYSGNEGSYFSNNGLINKNGVEKMSFTTLFSLIKYIGGFTEVETIYSPNQNFLTHPSLANLYLLRFNFQSKAPVYVVWNEFYSSIPSTIDLSNSIPGNSMVINVNNVSTNESINSILISATPKIIIPASSPESQQYNIPLFSGANLISIPLIGSNTLANTLNTIEGKYAKVFAFNNQAKQWKSFDASLPAWANSLKSIDQTMGFWVYANSETTLTISGNYPSGENIPLYAGANLIGYPSLDTKPIEEALFSISGKYTKVFEYDSSAGSWKSYDASLPTWANSLTELRPGFGYWIYVNEDCNLVITNN